MRRYNCLIVLAGLTLVQTGCVVALGNRGSVRTPCCDRTAVAVNGEIYIVDLDQATKCKVEEVVSVAAITGATEVAE